MWQTYCTCCPESIWQPAGLVKHKWCKLVMYADSIHSNCPISSQVSRAWRVLAEDSVLWFKMCVGGGYHQDASVADSPCWKSTLRDCRNSAKTVRSNWKVGLICDVWCDCGESESLQSLKYNACISVFFSVKERICNMDWIVFSAKFYFLSRIEWDPSLSCSTSWERCCVTSAPVTTLSWLGEF